MKLPTLLIPSILLALIQISTTIFCSSNCIDYTGNICTDQTDSGCILCTTQFFSIIPSSGTCSLKTHTSIIAHELNNTLMDVTAYTTTSPSPFICGNYTFSGEYTANDYLYRNISGFGDNHYQVVVRYNIGYIGNWSQTDAMRLHIQDGQQSIYHDYYYSCGSPQNSICGQPANSSDCIKIQTKTLAHNASYLQLNFSTFITETDPTVQSWGIKELMVVARLCHSRCATCFAATDSDCLSCAAGFFLQGNVCLDVCGSGYYTVVDQSRCVQSCPSGYFADDVTKVCGNCQPGCNVCSSYQLCQAWEHLSADEKSMWQDKMQFWILLIIVLVVVILFVLYKIVRKIMSDEEEKAEEMEESISKVSAPETSTKKQTKQIQGSSLEKGSHLKSEDHLMSMHENTQENVFAHTGVVAEVEQIEPSLWFNEAPEGESGYEPPELKSKPKRKRRFKKQREQNQDQLQIQMTIDQSTGKM